MRFENYIKTKAFSQNGKAFLLPTTTGLAVFCSVRFVLVVSVNCV